MIKIAIVMPIWAPMRHLLFEELASKSRVQLKVFYEKKEVPHRPSWKPFFKSAYDYDIVYSYHPRWLRKYHLIPYRLPFHLDRYQPDIVIVVTLAQAIFALMYTRLKHKRIILWTGESEHIIACRSMPNMCIRLREILYPFFDGFGCYSKETMFFLKHTFDVPSSKIFQIQQSVDNEHFIDKREAPASVDPILSTYHNKKIFLCVGQLIYLKGYDLLIKAWKNLPEDIQNNTILRIVGAGPLKSNLNNLIYKGGLDNIELLGFVDYKDLPFLYKSADVFIFPTREDTWGFVINEAMACGLPVLCSKYANAKEMVVEGENGYIFDPFNAEDTISKIKIMYKRQSEWNVMGKRGRDVVVQQYSAGLSVKAILGGIRQISP